mmetsp:Transcript_2631/g.9342  ORF Transcript_2631/g.9342 Transcript_2631/m.9342 type:complete len:128 (+) Transcript_2631:38-421(+)
MSFSGAKLVAVGSILGVAGAHWYAQERRLDQQLDPKNLRSRERMWRAVEAPLLGETGPEHRAFLKEGALGRTPGDIFQVDEVFSWPPLVVGRTVYSQNQLEDVAELPPPHLHRRRAFQWNAPPKKEE